MVSAVILWPMQVLIWALRAPGRNRFSQQDVVLEGLVLSFDLAMGLGMHRGAADMAMRCRQRVGVCQPP